MPAHLAGGNNEYSGYQTLAYQLRLPYLNNPVSGYDFNKFRVPNGVSTYANDIYSRFSKKIADINLYFDSSIVNTGDPEARCLAKVQEYVSSLAN